MKSVLAFFFACVLSTSAIAQAGGSTSTTINVTIQGYVEGEFKVNDGIEQQIITKVVKPIEAAMPSANAKLAINVFGYTDHVGITGKNDDLGNRRAEQVGNTLAMKFPEARIIVSTKGDSAGVRKVTVECTITTTPPAPAPNSASHQRNWIIGGVSFLLIALVAFFFGKRARIEPELMLKPTIPTQPLAEVAPATSTPESMMREFKKDGKVFLAVVTTTKTDAGWELPFEGLYHFRADRKNARRAIKEALEDPERQLEIEKLISQGIIKVKE